VPRFRTDERVRALITNSTKPRIVDYPGQPSIKVGVRGLDDVELDHCRVEAAQKIHDIAKTRRWDPVQTSELDPALLERFVEREIVLRAFIDPDTLEDETPVLFFANVHELKQVGATGVTDLMNVYIEHQEWANPNVSIGPEEEKELVDALGKEQSAALYLTGIEPSILRRLLISSVKRLHDYRTGKCSTSKTSEPSTTPRSEKL